MLLQNGRGQWRLATRQLREISSLSAAVQVENIFGHPVLALRTLREAIFLNIDLATAQNQVSQKKW